MTLPLSPNDIGIDVHKRESQIYILDEGMVVSRPSGHEVIVADPNFAAMYRGSGWEIW